MRRSSRPGNPLIVAALAVMLLMLGACAGDDSAPGRADPVPGASDDTGDGGDSGDTDPSGEPGSSRSTDTGTGTDTGTDAGTDAGTDTTVDVRWSDCADQFECATLPVPLDYTDPGGTQIEIALTRRPAEDGDRRIGSLVVNFGGPGAPGVEFLQAGYESIPEGVRERFDLVSFDPRGVGQSTAIECDDDTATAAAFDGDPDTSEELAESRRLHEEFVADCVRNAGDLLPFLGTNNAARDMDRVRAAIGDETLTYLGYSYGTSLGYAYAALFPARIRALVLDGVVDPQLEARDSVSHDAASFEDTITAFFAACEARRSCPIGPDPREVMDRVLARLKDGETLPTDPDLLGEDGRVLHLGEAQIGILRALYDAETGWQYLEARAGSGRRGRRHHPAGPIR